MSTLRSLAAAFAVVLVSGCAVAAEGDEKIRLADCPAAVQKTVRRESIGGTINAVTRHGDDAQVLYSADVTLDGSDYALVIEVNGTLVGKLLDDGEDHTELEEDVELSECPAAVQRTLVREAQGFEIDVVARRTTNGRTVYLLDAEIDRKDYSIMVDEAGKLISKSLYEDELENEGEWDETQTLII